MIKIMKINFLVIIVFFPLLLGASPYSEEVCWNNEEYGIILCGDWSTEEIDEVMSFLLGDEEIHKIVKNADNYYLLHTCENRNEKGRCTSGKVHAIERKNKIILNTIEGRGDELIVSPDSWDWVDP